MGNAIFSKISLKPNQMRTVADRRFDDAEALRRTKQNKHANGAMYLGGFVLECLLKAKMLEKYPDVRANAKTKTDRKRRDLIYRYHDLDGLLGHLDGLKAAMTKQQYDILRMLCGQWTVFARYSPKTAKMQEAVVFLDKIKGLRKCLK